MSDVLEHLENALEELTAAKAKAELGTSLMIHDVISDLQSLIDRHENINASDSRDGQDDG